MPKRKVITLAELLEDFTRCTMHPHESAREVALQRSAFLCGVVSATGILMNGDTLDMDDLNEIVLQAMVGLQDTEPTTLYVRWESQN